MGAEDLSEAIFGSFDGVVSVIGVIVALLGHPDNVIVSAAIGLAAASAVGMAAGQYLGDASRSLRKAMVMGLATVVGTMVPVIPFILLDGREAMYLAAALVLLVTAGIAFARARRSSAMAYVETFGVLVVAAMVTAVVSKFTGSIG